MIVCADSSFVVSSYVRDAHSPEAVQRMARRPNIVLTQLNRAEFANAVYRYVFHGLLTVFQARRTWDELEKDCGQGVWRSVSLPENIWQRSIDLARQYGPTLGVRTLDSLHVACALELGAERFWTFDERQARLAQAVGLRTSA